jgi:hypothetical protein
MGICVSLRRVGDEPPVLPGYRRPSCCTNVWHVRSSAREIKRYTLCPRILSPERNLLSRQDQPALPRLAGVRCSVCPSAADVATRTQTKPAASRDQQMLVRLPHNLRRARVRDLTVPTDLTLWQSRDVRCVRGQSRETIRVRHVLGLPLRLVPPGRNLPE